MNRHAFGILVRWCLVLCLQIPDAGTVHGRPCRQKKTVLDFSFQTGSQVIGVDPFSFAPNLVLQHTIDRIYRLPKNPVLEPRAGRWDAKDAADPFIVVQPDGVYLFYDGDADGHYRLGWARRDPQGWGWRPGGPIHLTSLPPWAVYHQIAPVVITTGTRWWLFLAGNASDVELGYRLGALHGSIPDSWQWVQAAPIINPSAHDWDFAGINYPDVLFDERARKFRMWYTGFQGPLAGIGYAESSDGIHWNHHGTGPVFAQPPGVIAPEVVFNGQTYQMYLTQLFPSNKGLKTRIIRTRSPDGVHWEAPETILEPVEKWEGRRLMRPNLSFFEGRIHLYYGAQKGSHWRIGEAVAEARFDTVGVWRSGWQSPVSGTLVLCYELPGAARLQARIYLEGKAEPVALPLQASARKLRFLTYESRIALPAETATRRWALEFLLRSDGTSSPLVFPPHLE